MEKFKYILLCAILLCTITTFAQPAQYTPMTAAGYQMKRLKVDSTLHLPSFCGVPTIRGSVVNDGALAIDTCGALLYMWTRSGGWDTINVSGGGNQDLQSVLNTGSTSINKDIDLYGKTTANEIYLSGMDNNFMPFMALGDSIGGGVYQYTYPKATIEFINKYMSQKLKGQDSTRSIIYLPVQTIDATDTLAKLSDVRLVSTIPTLQQVTTQGATTTNGISVPSINIGNAGSLLSVSTSNESLTITTPTNDELLYVKNNVGAGIKFGGAGQSLELLTYNGDNVQLQTPSTSGTIPISVNGYSANAAGNITIPTSNIDTTNQFVKRLDRTPGKDSIIYFVGENRFAIKDSVGTNPAPVGYYGSFYDTTLQSATVINTAYGVKLGVTDLTNGVTVSNNSKIKFANAGIYNIQFSLQLEKTGGSGNMIADIWLRKNNVNLVGTNGKVVLTGSVNASPIIAAWNYVVAISSNDSLELMWATDNLNVKIITASASSPHPSTASAILTVTQQSGIMAGTGISPLDTANMLLPYLRKIDTITLSNRINLKLNTADTSTLSARINLKLNTADTSTLSARINLKLNTADTSTLSARINLKLNTADTSTLSNRINLKLNTADTSTLSNRINLKLNTADTSTLSNRINLKLNATDTASLSNRINLKLNTADANQTIAAFQYLGSSIKFFPIGVSSFVQATTNLQFVNTRIFLTAIYVPTTTTVTGVKWITGSTGTSYVGGANYNGIALYSYNVGTGLCTRIDSTASDANTWTTAGFNSKAFVTTASLSQGVYYLAAICNGTATTFPSIVQTLAQSAVTTYDFTSPAKLTGNSAGTVSPASFNLSTITSTTNTPVIALY